MKTINTLKYLAGAFILLGIFANFARNEYGIVIVNYTLITMTVALIVDMILISKTKRQNNIESSRLQTLGLIFFFGGVFLKLNFLPLAEILLLTSFLVIGISLFFPEIKRFKSSFKTKQERLGHYCLQGILIIGMLSVFFHLNKYTFASIISLLFLSLLIISIIILIFDSVSGSSNKPIKTLFKKAFYPNKILVLSIAIAISLYSSGEFFSLSPEWYKGNKPAKLIELQEKASETKAKADREKYSIYSDNYYGFLKKLEDKD